IKASHQALIPLVENSKTGSSKTGSDAGAQAKGQAGSNPDETSEGQSGSNPNETSEGQAGPDPGDAEARQLDEGFTATVYPNVQENLKLVVDEPVLLEEPASSSRTLSSLQHLTVQSFGSGITFLLAVAFFCRQWEVPSGSENFLTSSGNALCILFPAILP
nr:hypothetical protein [Tanacetum cinerariifolium]